VKIILCQDSKIQELLKYEQIKWFPHFINPNGKRKITKENHNIVVENTDKHEQLEL